MSVDGFRELPESSTGIALNWSIFHGMEKNHTKGTKGEPDGISRQDRPEMKRGGIPVHSAQEMILPSSKKLSLVFCIEDSSVLSGHFRHFRDQGPNTLPGKSRMEFWVCTSCGLFADAPTDTGTHDQKRAQMPAAPRIFC